MAYYSRGGVYGRRHRRGYRRGYGRGRRSRRHWRPIYPRGRRRHRFRLQTVRQTRPRRRKTIIIQGWEPLGNICSNDTPKSRATPYCSLEKGASDCKNSSQWHGTYGYHWHTLYNLILRSRARWCRFSSDWESYDYIQFGGGTIWLPQTQDHTYMFNAQPYWLSQHFVDSAKNQKSNEETWVHPGYLIHAPGTRTVRSRRLAHYPRMKKYRIKVPTSWEGWIPIKDAINYVMYFWAWTWCDLERAFFDPCTDPSVCMTEPWWGLAPDQMNWVDREKYDTPGGQNKKNWGPFLPEKNCSGQETSLWFLYRLKIRVAGESIWAPVPRDPVEQGYIPSAPSRGSSNQIQPYTGDPRRGTRPWATHDLLPTDVDSDGIITDEALGRITARDEGEGYKPPIKRRRMGRHQRRQRFQRPSKHKLRKLQRILRGYMVGCAQDADQNKP